MDFKFEEWWADEIGEPASNEGDEGRESNVANEEPAPKTKTKAKPADDEYSDGCDSICHQCLSEGNGCPICWSNEGYEGHEKSDEVPVGNEGDKGHESDEVPAGNKGDEGHESNVAKAGDKDHDFTWDNLEEPPETALDQALKTATSGNSSCWSKYGDNSSWSKYSDSSSWGKHREQRIKWLEYTVEEQQKQVEGLMNGMETMCERTRLLQRRVKILEKRVR